MSYKALYRQYRPKNFNEVAGQKLIKKTFMNALKNDKVAHAYLFSGPRGTGKTSIAKILAKGVNCEKFPIEDPCNECQTCIGINNNTISDVIEIDAASNNSVDEIRDIREKSNFLPSVAKYKVYIIDEVHMLTINAFNALLKTLEEPPSHVIFILATTEPQKIPSTIISRCQCYDFKGITITEIRKRLTEIKEIENIEITDEAINLIAENSEGGMRDALSYLDQAVSYTDELITKDIIYDVSGDISIDKVIKIFERLVEKDSSSALKIINELVEDGKDITKITSSMIYLLRDLLINKNIDDIDNLEKNIFLNENFKELSEILPNQKIYFYLENLNQVQNNIKWAYEKRTFLEIAIVKMVDDVELFDVESLITINKLEKKVIELEERLMNGEFDKKTDKPQKINKKETPKLTINIVQKIIDSANKEKRFKLIQNWERLKLINDLDLKPYAKLLYAGEIVAINENAMILVYDDLLVCNRMMLKKTQTRVKQILNRKTILINDYIAIPRDVWENIRNDIVNQVKEGIKKPIIKDIDLKVVTESIIETTDEIYDNRSEMLKFVEEIFEGYEIIIR